VGACIYVVVIINRLKDYLQKSKEDRWRQLYPRMSQWVMLKYVYSSQDEEDAEIRSLRVRIKKGVLQAVASVGSIVVFLVMYSLFLARL
jgi:hypothetical protein